jgi:poly-gamma-glutamate synthesis protein (capsule biosynthesis protein)
MIIDWVKNWFRIERSSIKKVPVFFICFIAVFIYAIFYYGEPFNTPISTTIDYSPTNHDIKQTEPEDIPVIPEPITNPIDLSIPEFIRLSELGESEDDPVYPETVLYDKKRHAREILISAVGDLTLASNYNKSYGGSFYEFYDLYGPEYFCENIVSIFNESDCVIANLECALTDNKDPAIRQVKQFSYKGYKEYTSILLASNIDVVTIANNHSFDYSQAGYDDTIDALKTAGIDYHGNGIVSIKEVNGIKIGFAGVVGTARMGEIKNALDYMKAKGAEIKIVSFHWGFMDARIADASQVKAARLAIDYGADLVIGHHPHVLQGIEIYKGKYIAYSLGNFIFDGNVISDVENRTSVIFQINFALYGTEIVDSSINLIPILVTSNFSRNNFKPALATGDVRENILNKIKARSVH